MSYCHFLKTLDKRQSRERETASRPHHSLKATDLSLDRQNIKFDVNESGALRDICTIHSVANGTSDSSQQNLKNAFLKMLQGCKWLQVHTEINVNVK